jgi:hypothetical protein
MKHLFACSALLFSLAAPTGATRADAQIPVGTGALSICVVSHDASNTFFTSTLATGGDAAQGEAQYARFLAWLAKQGKASGQEAGNCYFGDDGARITAYVQHLDDGCDSCAKWTIVETEWTPGMGE